MFKAPFTIKQMGKNDRFDNVKTEFLIHQKYHK